MERLRDQTSSPDAVTARAAELLSAMPPLDVGRLRQRPLPDLVPRRAPVRLRMGMVLALMLGTVVAAAATVRTWPLRHATESPAAAPPPESTTSSSRGVSSPFVVASPSSTTDVTADPVAEIAAAASAGALPGPAMDVPEPARGPSMGPGSKGSQRDTGAVEDESTLMVRAVRALRREGDPARAQALAEQALQRFPHGAQAEEAMALIMEAASARGDASGAQRAASAYLARFRAGRFVDRAQRILASSPAR